MNIEVSINGKKVVDVKGLWNCTVGSSVKDQFHDLARLAHHALDKAVREMMTAKVEVR